MAQQWCCYGRRRTATMSHRCCCRSPSDRNDGPSMLRQPHRWAIVVVPQARRTATMSHRCGSGSRFGMVTVRAGQMGLVLGGQNPGAGWRGADPWRQPPRQPANPGTSPAPARRHRLTGAGNPQIPGTSRAPARRHRLAGHFGSAHRNDVPPMLFAGGGQPQLWAIVAAATASMGHRCGCPARLSSNDVPSLRLRPGGRRRSARCARD